MGSEIIAKSFVDLQLADGKTYRLAPLSIGMIADLEQWVKDRRRKEILGAAKELYGENVPASVFAEVAKPVTDAEIEAAQESPAGLLFLLWRALMAYHPAITLEETGNLVTTEALQEYAKHIGIAAQNPEQKKTDKETQITSPG